MANGRLCAITEGTATHVLVTLILNPFWPLDVSLYVSFIEIEGVSSEIESISFNRKH